MFVIPIIPFFFFKRFLLSYLKTKHLLFGKQSKTKKPLNPDRKKDYKDKV